MTTFDKREEAFEQQFAHDEELRFKATARRNKLVGLWAAEKLGLQGADAEGYAGLEDDADNHWGMLFKAAILSTTISVGSEAGTSNNENALVQALRQGTSDSISQTGRQVVQRSLNVQPTITIRPGFPVRVLVTHDLVLEPYRT